MGLFKLILIMVIDGQYVSTPLQGDLDVKTCSQEASVLQKDKEQGQIFLPELFELQSDAQERLWWRLDKTKMDRAYSFMCVPQGTKR